MQPPFAIHLMLSIVLVCMMSHAAAIRDDFVVQDDHDAYDRFSVDIGCTSHGDGVLSWCERRSEHSAFSYLDAVRFDQTGRYEADSAAAAVDFSYDYYALAVTDSGYYAFVASEKLSLSTYDLFLLRYHADGTPFSEFGATLARNQTGLILADVDLDNNGRTVVVYSGVGDSGGLWIGMVPRVQDPDVAWYPIDTAGSAPRVAIDDIGRAFVCYRRGFELVYRVFNVNSTPMAVHEPRVIAGQITDEKLYDVDCSPGGDFVVTWQEATGECIRVRAQRYGRTGAAVGGPIAVSPCADNTADKFPRVSVGLNGSFAVSWCHPGLPALRLRIFEPDGAPATGVIDVAVDESVKPGPVVPAVDAGGNVLVAWTARPGDNEDVFLRRYDANGIPTGPSQRMHTRGLSLVMGDVGVCRSTGSSVTAWSNPQTPEVFVRVFDDRGMPTTSDIPLEINAWGRLGEVRAAMDSMVFAACRIGGGANLYILNGDGSPVYDGSAHVSDTVQQIALDAGGHRTVLAWANGRHGTDSVAQVQATVYGYGGGIIADTILIGDGTRPSVAVADNGTFAVSYQQTTTQYAGHIPVGTSSDVYLRTFTADGTPVSATVPVEQAGEEALSSAVGLERHGAIVVAWLQEVEPFVYRVYFRRFSAQAEALGAAMRADTGTGSKSHIDIAVGADGAIRLCWKNLGTGQVEMRTFNADDTPQTGVVTPSELAVVADAPSPRIAAADGRSFLGWANLSSDVESERDIWGELAELADQGQTGVSSRSSRRQDASTEHTCGDAARKEAIAGEVRSVKLFDIAGRRLRDVRRGKTGRAAGVIVIRRRSPGSSGRPNTRTVVLP